MELDAQTIILALAPIVLLLVEYYLGKAEVPKANSVIQLIINLIKVLTGKSSTQ